MIVATHVKGFVRIAETAFLGSDIQTRLLITVDVAVHALVDTPRVHIDKEFDAQELFQVLHFELNQWFGTKFGLLCVQCTYSVKVVIQDEVANI